MTLTIAGAAVLCAAGCSGRRRPVDPTRTADAAAPARRRCPPRGHGRGQQHDHPPHPHHDLHHPESGQRRRLGDVGAGQSAVLTYRGTTAGQAFRLVAQLLGSGQVLASRGFALSGVGVVEWDLYRNVVTTAAREP
jgi:hypothetical protein